MKYYYYIGVKTNQGLNLVTKIDNSTKSAFWKVDGKPLKLSLSTAKDISWALCINGYESCVVTTLYEYEAQPFIFKE